MTKARHEAAVSAYSTALDWLYRYPVHEVEQRLINIIAAKKDGAVRTAQKLESS